MFLFSLRLWYMTSGTFLLSLIISKQIPYINKYNYYYLITPILIIFTIYLILIYIPYVIENYKIFKNKQYPHSFITFFISSLKPRNYLEFVKFFPSYEEIGTIPGYDNLDNIFNIVYTKHSFSKKIFKELILEFSLINLLVFITAILL